MTSIEYSVRSFNCTDLKVIPYNTSTTAFDCTPHQNDIERMYLNALRALQFAYSHTRIDDFHWKIIPIPIEVQESIAVIYMSLVIYYE